MRLVEITTGLFVRLGEFYAILTVLKDGKTIANRNSKMEDYYV